MMTRVLPPDERGLGLAAAILSDGGLVAFPTETVYGLGADARNGRAVAAIYETKGRPEFNPLIVHVSSLGTADIYADIKGPLRKLAEAFWPGPLTLVAPRRPGPLSDLVTAGLETVAIRVPAHPVARNILDLFDGPVAAPSANPSGRISPTTDAHVLAHLDGKIDAIMRAGACQVGLESTIIGLEGDQPVLLRPGGLPIEVVAEALMQKIGRPLAETITSPGQLQSHYAPSAPLRINAMSPEEGEHWLGFGPDAYGGSNLSRIGDLREAAANLFGMLHRLDGGPPIAVASIPEEGLGQAINDRLRRAAAPRS
ncbi:MAG: L-threonylcarbamoyladenylate synthase [Pseudomonadota bacterium]